MIKFLDEIKKASDDELLNCVKEATDVPEEEFEVTFGTDYPYSSLVSELNKRGWENTWFSPASKTAIDKILIDAGCEKTRYNIPVDKRVGDGFATFLNNLEENGALSHGMKYVYYTAALIHFMSDYHKGKVKVELALPEVHGYSSFKDIPII